VPIEFILIDNPTELIHSDRLQPLETHLSLLTQYIVLTFINSMHPKLGLIARSHQHRRRQPGGGIGFSTSESFTKSSMKEEASLLLSLSDIVMAEIESKNRSDVFSSSHSADSMPRFPSLSHLSSDTDLPQVTPRLTHYSRARTVSIDQSGSRTPSPTADKLIPMVTPVLSPRRVARKSRSTRAKVSYAPKDELEVAPRKDSSNKLQGAIPQGTTLKIIHRKKFSWRNHPVVSFNQNHLTSTQCLTYILYSLNSSLLPIAKSTCATRLSTTLSNRSSTTTS